MDSTYNELIIFYFSKLDEFKWRKKSTGHIQHTFSGTLNRLDNFLFRSLSAHSSISENRPSIEILRSLIDSFGNEQAN